MWPVSAAFQSAIQSSHRVAVAATLGPWSGTQADVTPYLLRGTVSVDRTRAQRRTCSVEFADRGDGVTVPGSGSHPFSPTAGQYLRLYRGIEYLSGVVETAPLGVFRVVQSQPVESGDGIRVNVEGVDLSWSIGRAAWTAPWAIAAGTTAEAAIAAIVNERSSVAVSMSLQTTGYQLPALIYGLGGEDASDPWTACQSIATDAGYDLFFNQAGTLVMQSTPTPASPAVLTYSADAVRVMLTAERTWDGNATYNGVIVQAENPDLTAPLSGAAYDLDPGSATYWYGAFGRFPEIISSDRIQTQPQADAAAQERLNRRLGRGVTLAWTQIVNPALDAGDVIRVVRPGLRLDDKFVVDSLEVPLTAAEGMSAAGRATSSVLGDV